MAEKKKKKKAIFSADVELTRINENNVRYRVLNHEGLGLSLSHLEFPRDGFPRDDDFNMDFIMNDLAPDADGKKPPREVVEKQKAFRSFVNYKLAIF